MAETAKADYREDLEPDTNLYRDVNITSSGYPEGNDVSALNLLKSLASIIRFYVEQTRYLTAVFLCLDNNKRVSWVYFDEDRNTIGASNQTQNTTSTLSRRQSTNNSVSLSATQLKTDSINARPRIQFKTEFYGPEVRQEYYFEAIAGLLLECGPYAKTNPLTEDFHEETVHEVAVRVTRNVARSHAPAVLTSEDVIDMLKIAAEEATQQAEGGELEIENVDEGKGKGNGVDAAVASKGVAVPSSVVETS
ncbi:uncharacterized protein KY384_007399 [Bacidia gigantensis]|uniref:uncharacterized protein n=1 Tax=Bacidia gigantensis TaxID=2732470 RepID=UPI001D045052|nr:uncharacterized protein KY384_007399 [Bacidia gigantensis]KAG8528481.1 hypothetical protein KY384_007399 [Bacidia gigantensis]